jgi:AcrR family transcriptional regulator
MVRHRRGFVQPFAIRFTPTGDESACSEYLQNVQQSLTVRPVELTVGDLRPGLRERKKRATRRTLQRIALELSAERGVEHVTIEDIAAAADVSPRTFFNYFSSKEEALVAPDTQLLELMARQVVDRPKAESPLEALRTVLVHHSSVEAAELDLLRLRMAVVEPHPALLPHLVGSYVAAERLFAEAVAERTGTDVDRDAYPPLVAAVAAAALRTALHLWRTSDFEASVPDLLDRCFAHLAEGLPAPHGAR